jgi:hypothetical protein
MHVLVVDSMKSGNTVIYTRRAIYPEAHIQTVRLSLWRVRTFAWIGLHMDITGAAPSHQRLQIDAMMVALRDGPYLGLRSYHVMYQHVMILEANAITP